MLLLLFLTLVAIEIDGHKTHRVARSRPVITALPEPSEDPQNTRSHTRARARAEKQ